MQAELNPNLVMGRTPCCAKVGLNRGPWTPDEDLCLSTYIKNHGEGHWRTLPREAGLLRCGKSCRLRWINYLRPDVKRGQISPEEEDLILRLHSLLGNRWALIAGRMPGRTDNEIKNYWNIHLSKKLIIQGIDPRTHKPLSHVIPESGDQDPISGLERNIIDPEVSFEDEILFQDNITSPLISSKTTQMFADPFTSSSTALAKAAEEPFKAYLMPKSYDRMWSNSPAVPVKGNLDLSNDSYVSGNPLSDKQKVLQELQASEMEFQNYNMQAPRSTNYSPPSLSVHNEVGTSSVGLASGDEFCFLLDSFVNE